MSTINQQNAVTSVALSDQIALFASGAQTTRRATVSQLLEAMEQSFVPRGGLLSLSSIYVLRGVTPVAAVLTATPIPMLAAEYTYPAFSVPAGAGSFVIDPVNGRFIAVRQCTQVQVWASVNGNWPSGSVLTMGILVGDQVTPFSLEFKESTAGLGASVPLCVSLNGIGTNMNDPLGIIQPGQTIRLVLSMVPSGTINITSINFSIQPLDGQ